MLKSTQKKASLFRALIIAGLILSVISPVSARALTQDFSASASGSVSRIGHTVKQLAPFAGLLPSGTIFLPSLLVNTIDTSLWSHPSTDPAGIAYFPLTGELLVSDTEIEEVPQPFWDGFNIFQSTLAGSLSGNCTTFTGYPLNTTYNNFSDEPSGIAINPSNNQIFFSDDVFHRVFEIGLGTDGTYCTSDDTVTVVSVASFGAGDAEDVAYGQNKLFIAGGIDAEVYVFDLGANGVLDSSDLASLTQFDTASLGFADLEGVAYNAEDDTLFILSTSGGDPYLGETTTSGTLLRAYDLTYLGTENRSGLTVAPASGDPSSNNIYIVSRGVDNADDPDNNDGKIWEIDITDPVMPDLIFKDGFESNDFSAWTLSNINGGNLSVSLSAALLESYGMRALINSATGIDVIDDSPTLESRYRARFYFDPNSIAMGAGVQHTIFQG
ncbi:MAG TPA: hypothetical protein VKE92_06420, partial [Anaerolineales bacterium]|nr:hypothetical protein [Anaerolineales bacterium]